MQIPGAVRLVPAGAHEAPLLLNLLQLYIHDLSEIFQVELGADARYAYPKLPLYWSEPAGRHAFLIRSGERLAGFALVTRGSPATQDPTDLDIAEFFVLRAFRRSGVGQLAAHALWNRLPGRWVVRVAQANRAGASFWSGTIDRYTRGEFAESTLPGEGKVWRVFTFRSTGLDDSA
jgi:predicted acetyltransferase